MSIGDDEICRAKVVGVVAGKSIIQGDCNTAIARFYSLKAKSKLFSQTSLMIVSLPG
jgi:hypothetical protein